MDADQDVELKKLKVIIRKIFNEDQELKETLEKTISECNQKISILKNEKEIALEEVNKLKNETYLSTESVKENEKIDELLKEVILKKKQINDINESILNSKMNYSVMQKQADEYKAMISALEDEIIQANIDSDNIKKQDLLITSLEDEINEKDKKLEELEISNKMLLLNIDEINNKILEHKNKINALSTYNNSFDIFQKGSELQNCFLNTYKILEKKQNIDDMNDVYDTFFKLPNKISLLNKENKRLQILSKQIEEKYNKLKSIKDLQENDLSPEKMKKLLEKLIEINKQKTEKINKLKIISEKQCAALKFLHRENYSFSQPLISSLKESISKLESCEQSKRDELLSLSENILESLIKNI